MAERVLPEIVIEADPSKRSPGLLPVKKTYPLPAAPVVAKPTAAGKVTGLLLTAVIWGGLGALAMKAFRSIRGK